jgi:3-oxoadipate enol-lactonase
MFSEFLEAELPDCEYREIADTAHMPMLERPNVFNSAVREFLL